MAHQLVISIDDTGNVVDLKVLSGGQEIKGQKKDGKHQVITYGPDKVYGLAYTRREHSPAQCCYRVGGWEVCWPC